jgi:ADP-ribose pyrophosphatase YjhB (NUDIX family)
MIMIPTDTYLLHGRETVSRWRATPFSLPDDAVVEVSAFCFNEDDQLIVVSGDGAAWALPAGAGAGDESPDEALTRAVAETASAVVERSVYLGAEEIEAPGQPLRSVRRFWVRVTERPADPSAREALDPEAAMMRIKPVAPRCAWAGLHAALEVNAKFRPLKDFYAGLPRKRMAAGAIVRNALGEILLVKPTYRPDWLIPGGITEADESPRHGCAREAREEIGLEVALGRLLCVEYLPREGPKTETVQWVFDGGVLDPAQIAAISLQASELSEYRFVPPGEALRLLNRSLGRRVTHALKVLASGGDAYLEG